MIKKIVLINFFILSAAICFGQVNPKADTIRIDSSYQQRINKTPMDTSLAPQISIPPPSGNPENKINTDSTLHKRNIDDQDPKKTPRK